MRGKLQGGKPWCEMRFEERVREVAAVRRIASMVTILEGDVEMREEAGDGGVDTGDEEKRGCGYDDGN